MTTKQPKNVINPNPLGESSVFNNIYPPEMGQEDPKSGYFAPGDKLDNSFTKVKQFQLGQGDNTIKMDRQGFWLGGEKFENARFKIYMDGTLVYNDGITDRILIGQAPE